MLFFLLEMYSKFPQFIMILFMKGSTDSKKQLYISLQLQIETNVVGVCQLGG